MRRAGLHLIDPVQVLDPLRREDRRHRLDRPQLVADSLDMASIENASLHGGRVGVIRVGVPPAEFEVLEVSERNEVLDEGVAVLVAFSEPDV